MALKTCQGMGLRFGQLVSVLASLFTLAACELEPAHQSLEDAADSKLPATSMVERIPEPSGPPALCARDRSDLVRDVICADDPAPIRSLADLQRLLRLDAEAEENTSLKQMYGVNRFFAALGHSTALSGHRVSPLNPRLIILGNDMFAAYQRGVQKVEVIVLARGHGSLNFYLFEFAQACNDTDAGCTPGDLYTARVESDWLRVRVQDDEDLKNTPNDCLQCHQRGLREPTLLMRELNNPWTHFFQPPSEPAGDFVGPGVQGNDLFQDYVRAKGDERYGGYAVESISAVAPFILESTVGPDQPVLFDAPGIENERWPYDSADGYAAQAGDSPTWTAAYEAFKRGEQLALPYMEPRVTDSDKHQRATEAYARYRAGEISEAELPDLADVFPEDPLTRAKIGLQTEPDASAEETLIQACGSCHNDVLDQKISRARFNIDLWKLDQAEIRTAIERIERPQIARGSMPPYEARQLDPGARQRLLAYLRDQPLAKAPDPRLQHAAEIGMAGGARRRAISRR
jgi:mono/diheme cytochrome c family protein